MLQQTQVARVVPRYLAFLERWPTVEALAAASPARGSRDRSRARSASVAPGCSRSWPSAPGARAASTKRPSAHSRPTVWSRFAEGSFACPSAPESSSSRNDVTGNIQLMATVLVVDDEPTIREIVVGYLKRSGYQTLEAADGNRARELLESDSPDLVVLDLMLPGTDGLELCRWIRSRSRLPVLMLTARGEETDRIVGLELGADDYVTKPFSPRELAVRVRTVLRRSRALPDDVERVSFGSFEIDSASREVRSKGKPLKLTAQEFDLLWFLVSHPRRVFSLNQLLDRVWGYTTALDTGTVTVHIRRLREKIEPDPSRPRFLETVWGIGYRFTR